MREAMSQLSLRGTWYIRKYGDSYWINSCVLTCTYANDQAWLSDFAKRPILSDMVDHEVGGIGSTSLLILAA
eukprot:362818-Chlamydomonas_euryale.AAC.3